MKQKTVYVLGEKKDRIDALIAHNWYFSKREAIEMKNVLKKEYPNLVPLNIYQVIIKAEKIK